MNEAEIYVYERMKDIENSTCVYTTANMPSK